MDILKDLEEIMKLELTEEELEEIMSFYIFEKYAELMKDFFSDQSKKA